VFDQSKEISDTHWVKKKKKLQFQKCYPFPGFFNFPEINVGALFCVYTRNPTTIELSSSKTSLTDRGSGGDIGRPPPPPIPPPPAKSKGGGGGGRGP